jgi:hypothetical protein
MVQFLWGATCLGCWVAGLFFLRFWRRTRDRFFVFFAAAFWLLALNWLMLGIADPGVESRHWVYVLRIVAFLVLIAAILDKNRPGRPS